MDRLKNSRIPVITLYVLFFLAGGLSRNLFGIPTSSLSAFIYIVMVAVWFHDVSRRILDDSVGHIVSAVCSFCFYLLIVRTIKYALVFEVTYLKTITWYLPSIGVMQIGTLLLFLSIEIGGQGKRGFKKYHLLAIPGILINILTLTNDFHQLVYKVTTEGDYGHGVFFYVYIGWVVILFGSSLLIMYRKCSVSPGRKYVWIPFAVLAGSFLAINIIGTFLVKLSYRTIIKYNWYEVFIVMVIAYIESCIAIGLIPSRTGFDTLFRESSVAIEIEDTEGNTVMRSSVLLGEGDDKNILRKHAAIPGGYICWNDDITDINRITESILTSEHELSEQEALIKAEKKLHAKEEEYTIKTAIYDNITRAVAPQAEHIEELLSQGDPDFTELVVYGVFIKRKANLMITSAGTDQLSLGELYLSLKDALEYLKLRDIKVTLTLKGTYEDLELDVPASVVISLFDGYERYVEENLKHLNAIKVTIVPGDKPRLHIDAVTGKEEESYVLS